VKDEVTGCTDEDHRRMGLRWLLLILYPIIHPASDVDWPLGVKWCSDRDLNQDYGLNGPDAYYTIGT
jgi:hypothetical protein